ncbi:calcium-binding protein [Actinoplanes sp. CA-015351]|uniref:calcium-binding protein n=1 Tax=Actinoplanes sp. CA-015351 TaxID=3239897 RepID=UPI003D9998C1
MSWSSRMPIVVGAALLTGLSATLVGSPAQAATPATAKVSGRTVLYTAAKGQQNKVVVTVSGRTVTIDDRVAIKAGKGCKKVKGDKTKVRCTTKKAPTWLDIYTGTRNDSIVNKTGIRMTADGGSGNDSITGGSAADYLSGGTGNDKIWGQGGNDYVTGNSGNDRLSGGNGNDTVFGNTGHDGVNGDNGRDLLGGGAGNDRFSGGAGDDVIGWDDTDVSGADNDVYSGGTGFDLLDAYKYYKHAVRIDIDGGADDGKSGEKDNVRTDIENILGSPKNDRIYGSNRGEYLDGGAGNDTIYGNGGVDQISGSRGADTLDGGAGNDELIGDFPPDGVGADVLRGGAGTDLVNYTGYTKPVTVDLDGAARDDGQAGEGDTVGTDVENIYGGEGNDRLTGNAAANYILGGYGKDTIFGGTGNDELSGDGGNDYIYGEAGDDYLDGTDFGSSAEPDRLDGGALGDDLCRPWPDDVMVSCESVV